MYSNTYQRTHTKLSLEYAYVDAWPKSPRAFVSPANLLPRSTIDVLETLCILTFI